MPSPTATCTNSRQAGCRADTTALNDGSVSRFTSCGSRAKAARMSSSSVARMMQPARQILATSPGSTSYPYSAEAMRRSAMPCAYDVTLLA